MGENNKEKSSNKEEKEKGKHKDVEFWKNER